MKVTYNGVPIVIPAGVIYIATDRDGRIYGYSTEPTADSKNGVWNANGRKVKSLARLPERVFADWQGSLVRIDEIPKPHRMKEVAYKGGILQVPYNTTHLATDPQGTILAFTGQPTKSNNGWHGKGNILISHRIKTDSAGYTAWADSLMEISK